MSSLMQIEANRRNAAKSTGPRTESGKASSRLNARKHGVYADSPVIIGEDPKLYEALAASYFERFPPAAPEVHTLVTAIIRNAWLLDRLSRAETELWDRKLAFEQKLGTERYPIGRTAGILSPTLRQFQRRLDSIDRAFRHLEPLVTIHAQRTQPVPVENRFVPANSPAVHEPDPGPHAGKETPCTAGSPLCS